MSHTLRSLTDGRSLSPPLTLQQCEHFWYAEGSYACPVCNGKGEETCKACDGTGLSRPCVNCGPHDYVSGAPYDCSLATSERGENDEAEWTCRCAECGGKHWRPWEAE